MGSDGAPVLTSYDHCRSNSSASSLGLLPDGKIGEDGGLRSRYAFNSSSASNMASLPREVGRILMRPDLSLSVDMEPAASSRL